MDDLEEFAALNADPAVMEHFPATLSKEETKDFIDRLMAHYEKHGFNYFATEVLETGELIGFIGFAHQTYESECTPAVDIGWRLKQSAWGKGYATEGAKRCLEYGFTVLELNEVIATCTMNNTGSEAVMKKIGMTYAGEFLHPRLADHPDYQQCKWYSIKAH